MPETSKIRILLADEDAMRRDGLVAVLSAIDCFEVIGGASDGVAALREIRDQRPDVAVVDLNLPKLHGIELVRRVRAESFKTKVIILSGTADDEIVREAVRAGADGYLLKNGPARHLIDAISYVRDGGQYFSPQLRRDGRERHLLEEPARFATAAGPNATSAERSDDGADAERKNDSVETGSGGSRGRRVRRPPVRPAGSDPNQFRERIRKEASPDLNEHDYEIMSMMADGIRPILDRLDEIDNRVAQMETGDAPVPADPRGWLSTQFASTLKDPRRGNDVAVPGRGVNDLEARLPDLIEEAVTNRFHQMAGRLQQEIEETHVRTLETFVKNIQTKLVQRVSALEHDMSKQAEAMGELRDYSQRTEDNLSRLIMGVDRLAQELPKRLAAASELRPEAPPNVAAEESSRPGEPYSPIASRVSVRPTGGSRRLKILSVAGTMLLLFVGLAWIIFHFAGKASEQSVPAETAAVPGSRTEKSTVSATADTKTKMLAAQESVERKDYAVAEDLYKQIVKAEPGNVDALKALASVLYREEKIDESAAILDKLSKN